MPAQRIFLDANILVTVLCNEYPKFTVCAGKPLAKKKVGLLLENLKITNVDGTSAQRTIGNKKVHDFEDGLEYYSAVDAKCTCIVTYDKKDFYFSEMEVLDAREFLLKHAVK